MPRRHFRLTDKIRSAETSEQSGIRGEIIIGRGRRRIDYIDPFGNKSFRHELDEVLYRGTNIVPIGGYQFTFSKLFNIALDENSTLRVGDLNDESPQMKIGVNPGIYTSNNYDAECSISDAGTTVKPGVNIPASNFIFGFMMGDGGAYEDTSTAIAPDYKRRTLYRAIPFRMSNDGSSMAAGKYYGQSSVYPSGSTDPITSYYVKKFDSPDPRIIHVWVTDSTNGEVSIVDDTVYSSTSSTPIESYVEMNMTVDADDARGFFTSTGSTSRINEFGLVTGWYNSQEDEYEKLRLFTHFTRPSIQLTDNDAIDLIYRLYAR